MTTAWVTSARGACPGPTSASKVRALYKRTNPISVPCLSASLMALLLSRLWSTADLGKSKMHFVLPSAVDRASSRPRRSPSPPRPSYRTSDLSASNPHSGARSTNGSSRGRAATWQAKRVQVGGRRRASMGAPSHSPSPQRSVKRSTQRSHKRRASQPSASSTRSLVDAAEADADARSEGGGYGKGGLLMMYTGGGLCNGLIIAPVATPRAQVLP